MKDFNRISLGCVTFGREIGRDASFALMDHAQARGITFFDTAEAYGNGASERIIGEWLSLHRPPAGNLRIGTKILPPYSAAMIVAAVERCRERLGVAMLDLLSLHRWDPTLESGDALSVLDGLVRDGIVRTLGVSNFSAAQLRRSLSEQARLGLARFRVVQNNNNVAVREVDMPLRQLCTEFEVAIVTYSPLGAGFLTGKHQGGAAAGSRFDIVPGHQGVYFNDLAYRRLALLQSIATRLGESPVRLALAWALHQVGVSSVLVGGRTVAHLDQAFDAYELNLPGIIDELSAG